jgi:hypothetical protein
MKTILVSLLFCLTANAQSPEDFHKKYGPAISETFPLRQGIFLTVSYAKTGQVCEMIIHPQEIISDLDFPITKTMQSRTLTEIIDDLVPKSERGKPLMGTFLNMRCLPLDNCWGVMNTYERVTIERNGGDDKERYARIRWKGRECRE